MKAARYATSRQKACQQCSIAKAKCDRKLGRCTRCALRDLSCIYLQTPSSRASPNRATGSSNTGPYSHFSTPNALTTSESLLSSPGRELPIGESSIGESARSTGEDSSTIQSDTPKESRLDVTRCSSTGLETLDFSSLELLSFINVDDISNRWLNSYIPVPGQKVKDYPATITSLIFRLLKSYAVITVRGRGVPPFVHPSQMTAASTRPPLSSCLSLVRICEKPLPGSEGVAADVLQREMNNLYEQHGTYDDVTLLSAFQAYLIYSMVLFFRLGDVANQFLRPAMMNLQALACSSGRGGLVCTVEQQRARPRWEAWIVAEAKRRTLYTMYLFDSVLSAQDGLPTFLGTELQGLPAPANKSLWSAQSRHGWATAYNVYLADWPEGGLCIDELWPIPADLDEAGILRRRNRVDHWLEDIDEYGTMLYAVTSCTHGG
ncbi:hypothetical protein F4677DRAFT_264015 [Hypoxylon crocopeplum]|nr:hypothetical protein F4677DRAFT_264015 [Hypoxylon crocopeplum]